MHFSMGGEKGIDIDARLRSLMPSGTPEAIIKNVSFQKTMGDSNFPNRPALGQLNLIE